MQCLISRLLLEGCRVILVLNRSLFLLLNITFKVFLAREHFIFV